MAGQPRDRRRDERTPRPLKGGDRDAVLCRDLSPLARRERGLLGRGGRGDRLGAALGCGARRPQPAVHPLVRRGAAQHLLERARPPRRRRAGRADRADLGQSGDRLARLVQLPRIARPRRRLCRGARRARRRQGRPRADLHADGAGGGDRDARLRPHRRDPFGGVRRVRRARAGDPHRRRPAEVFWTASDVGWVVGHSYIVYAPLIYRCTSVMYEGKPVGTPDAGAFWRVIEQHRVRVFFTAPTAFRAIKREDPDGRLIRARDLSGFRALFLAGERADPPTIAWAEEHLKVPVIDHWWQTETGWPIGANCLGIERLPVKPGSCTRAVPGWDVRVLDAEDPGAARELPPGEIGAISIKLPLPPGALPTLWQADARFVESYLSAYPGYYQTGDAGFIDEDGYIHVMTRTDDIINVAGHRLSTGGMEEVLAAHPDVAECAVMGVADALKGQVPLGLLVLKAGVARPPEAIEREAVSLVRERIGPVASFKAALVVDRLPKTRSGKILRGTMRRIADGEDYRVPATIDDPAILGEIAAALARAGYPQRPS